MNPRIKTIVSVIIIVVIVLAIQRNYSKSHMGLIPDQQPAGESLPQIYSNSSDGFSIRLPSGYVVDESYKYQALGPGKDIFGTKFTIPSSIATGTNLSPDSYISVEEIPRTSSCDASLFVSNASATSTMTDHDTTYSVISSSEAAAGNRYEETVLAIPGTDPCVAVRYFIHYGAFENYPAGSIRQFDKQALMDQFDQIRRTLVVRG